MIYPTIVCNLKIGSLLQTIYINNNGETKEVKVPFEEVPNILLEQDIYDICFRGNADFAKKIEEKTKEAELHKYNKTIRRFHYF